jgi:threonine dehydrogenase-like Zn-dependent dehydrogenase
MKAALFYGGPDIRVEEVPDPVPGPGEVLVRVQAAGICGSDLHGYRNPSASFYTTAGPRLSGHELAGVVAMLGAGVTGLQVGQRVGVEPRHLVGCGQCRWCRRGDYHLCPTRGRVGDKRIHSTGFAEYSLEPAYNVYPLPDHVDMHHASILDVYACAVHALRIAPVTPASTVVVQGAGAIGLTALELYKIGGAKQVIVCDVVDNALEMATKLGADAVVNSAKVDPVAAVKDLTGGEGADVVVEAVGGMAPTFAADITMAARGGRVLVIGMYSADQSFAIREAQAKEINVQLCNSYSLWDGVPEFKISLDMMAAGKLRPKDLITHTFPLDKIGEGFEAAVNKAQSGSIKVIVLP